MNTEPITVPGVYDIPAEDYHADPVPEGSLSSSGARRLLSPGCPALFRYEQDHPPAPKKAFELGTAAHKLVLGEGPQLVRIDADEWRTKAIKEEVAKTRAAGNIPLKPAEYDQVHEMAEALREHSIASALFDPESGLPEQSLFWVDPPTGVWRRALLDWLPHRRPGRMVVGDYKTAHAVDPDSISKAVNDNGYYMQAAWYIDAVLALELADEAAFIFIFQSKEPPYLVTPVELDVVALKIGRALNRRALEIYKACVEADHWPGYTDDILLTPLPGWAEAKHLAEIS